MARHVGIVACSAEGAALCYRTFCTEAPRFMGEDKHPEVTMHTHSLGEYMDCIHQDDWAGVGRLMLSSARKLASLGAAFAICPDNTIHQGLPFVEKELPIPFLHIADAVAAEAKRRGFRKLALTGTRYLMTGPVYPPALEKAGLAFAIPDAEQRDRINAIIFEELVKGVFREESRLYFNQVYAGMKEQGCDAAVMGCTEIPLLVDPDDCPLPTLDSTRLLARAAIAEALRES
jgi:aspartate racemase